MTRELRVSLKVSNNRLKRAREDLNLSAREAAKRIGIHYAVLLKYEAMTCDPRSSRDGIRPSARRICAFYGAPSDYFWPEALLAVKMLKAEREIAADDVRLIPAGSMMLLPSEAASAEDDLEAQEKRALAFRYMKELSPQEAQILRMRFGFDGEEHTFDEIGAVQGKSRENARQTQEKALRKIRQMVRIERRIEQAKRIGAPHCLKCGTLGALGVYGDLWPEGTGHVCTKCDGGRQARRAVTERRQARRALEERLKSLTVEIAEESMHRTKKTRDASIEAAQKAIVSRILADDVAEPAEIEVPLELLDE
jgi:RNA polymerase sigma factor (sigma-70 family)